MPERSTRRADSSMTDSPRIVPDLVHEAAADALRRWVGPGKFMQADTLAELTGEKRNTVDGWRVRGARMSLTAMLRCAAVLPPAFADELLALAGLGGARRLAEVEVDGFATLAEMGREMAELAERLADRKLCAADRAALAPRFLRLAATLQEQGHAMSGPLRVVG